MQDARKKSGFTQEGLANVLGIGRIHVAKLERGISAPSLDLVLDLLDHLEVSTDYLLKGKASNAEKDKLRSVVSELERIIENI